MELPSKCGGSQNYPSGTDFCTEPAYRSAQDLVPGTVLQERISERSQVVEVPKFSCRDSVEMVKNVPHPQERSSGRMCESPDQLWQHEVEQNLNLVAWVGHDPAARALVLERLRERCMRVWPQLGGVAPSFSCVH